MEICELCNLECEKLTFHHLIPKTYHDNKRIKKIYKNDFLKKYGIHICTSCHNKIHSCIDEKDLAYNYNTLELLFQHPEISSFLYWRRKHPNIEYAISKKRK